MMGKYKSGMLLEQCLCSYCYIRSVNDSHALVNVPLSFMPCVCMFSLVKVQEYSDLRRLMTHQMLIFCLPLFFLPSFSSVFFFSPSLSYSPPSRGNVESSYFLVKLVGKRIVTLTLFFFFLFLSRSLADCCVEVNASAGIDFLPVSCFTWLIGSFCRFASTTTDWLTTF